MRKREEIPNKVPTTATKETLTSVKKSNKTNTRGYTENNQSKSELSPVNSKGRTNTSFDRSETKKQTQQLETKPKLNFLNKRPLQKSTNSQSKKRKRQMVAEQDSGLFMPIPDEEYMFDSTYSRKKMISPKRKRNKTAKDKQWWTKEEDEKLRASVAKCGAKNWKLISEMAAINKTDVQCLQRWSQVLRPGLKKGTWSKEEDQRLTSLVKRITQNEGPQFSIPWKKIERDMGGRTAKQCRERWKLSLDPNINKTLWTKREDKMLMKFQSEYGNSWSKIKDLLGTNRTENAVKLRYKCLKKREEKFKQNMSQYEKLSDLSKLYQYSTSVDSTLLQGRKRLKRELNLKKEQSILNQPVKSSHINPGGFERYQPYENRNYQEEKFYQPLEVECGGNYGVTSFDSMMEVVDSEAACYRRQFPGVPYLDGIGVSNQERKHTFDQYASVPVNFQTSITRENSTKSHDFDEIAKILSDGGL